MIIVSGSSNQLLAQNISSLLQANVADVDISKFPNGEKRVWIKNPLEGEIVAIVQSFSDPVDEHIIELALLADACRHLHAKKVIAVVPWFGYSPQDKSFREGEPISAHVIAKIIETMGVDYFITVDIHSTQVLDFFKIPTIEISSLPVFAEHFKPMTLENHTVISVDKGSRRRCQHFADELHLPLVQFDKVRDRQTGAVELELIDGDVKGKVGIGFDDFVSTGSTRISANKILKERGLVQYIDCITHPIFAGDSAIKVQDSQIDQLLVTDTYFLPRHKHIPKLSVLSVAPLISEELKKLT